MSMTEIEGVPTRESVKPGMAHFSGTGPAGVTCSSCAFFTPTSRGKLYRCAKYTQLTGKQGNCIKGEFYSCKYFEQKAKR